MLELFEPHVQIVLIFGNRVVRAWFTEGCIRVHSYDTRGLTCRLELYNWTCIISG